MDGTKVFIVSTRHDDPTEWQKVEQIFNRVNGSIVIGLELPNSETFRATLKILTKNEDTNVIKMLSDSPRDPSYHQTLKNMLTYLSKIKPMAIIPIDIEGNEYAKISEQNQKSQLALSRLPRTTDHEILFYFSKYLENNYNLFDPRNQVMEKNILEIIEKQKPKNLIVVVGGSHAYYLYKKFKERGIDFELCGEIPTKIRKTEEATLAALRYIKGVNTQEDTKKLKDAIFEAVRDVKLPNNGTKLRI